MAFDDKYYPKRKDWRKPYYGSKSVDRSCRSHGSCPWCQSGRKYRHKKKLAALEFQIKEVNEINETDESNPLL